MKTYLVTGGAGFIGSNFILYMLKKYQDIKIINKTIKWYLDNQEWMKNVTSGNYKKYYENMYTSKKSAKHS